MNKHFNWRGWLAGGRQPSAAGQNNSLPSWTGPTPPLPRSSQAAPPPPLWRQSAAPPLPRPLQSASRQTSLPQAKRQARRQHARLGEPNLLRKLTVPATTTVDLIQAAQALSAGVGQPSRRWWQFRSLPPSLALEVLGEGHQTVLALRGPRPALEGLQRALVATYGEIESEPADPQSDPLLLGPGEQASCALLYLEAPAALPLLVPEPRAWAAGQDALPGILQALSATPAPLRAVSQVVLRPAPARWGAPYQALLAAPRRLTRSGAGGGNRATSAGEVALGLLVGLSLLAWLLVANGQIGLLILCALSALLGGGALLAWAVRSERIRQRVVLAGEAVLGKLSRSTFSTCLRLIVIGPASAARERAAALERLTSLYTASFTGHNRLKVGRCVTLAPQGGAKASTHALGELDRAFGPLSHFEQFTLWLGGDRLRPVLSVEEVAALWHVPQRAGAIPGLQASSSRKLPAPPELHLAPMVLSARPPEQWADPLTWGPDARASLQGIFGGLAHFAGRSQPVRLPTAMLEGHLAVLGATGFGKSAFLEHLLKWAITDPDLVVFVLDVHNDLVRRLAGLVADADLARGRLVVLNPVDPAPVGFPSLWDAELVEQVRQGKWSREYLLHRQQQVISNLVNALERLSDGAWGARVRTNLMSGMATLMLASTNDLLAGRAVLPHTLLDIHTLFSRREYLDDVLSRLDDSQVLQLYQKGDWTYQFKVLSAPQALLEVQSVLTRIKPLMQGAARSVLGQREPRWSLGAALGARQICLVALGELGQEDRRTLGSLLVSYLQAQLLGQQALPLAQRPRVLVVIDEVQAYDPNSLVGLFGEVRKFGGRMVVATNSLQRIKHDSPQLFAELLNNVGTFLVGHQGDYSDALALLERLQGTREGPLSVSDLQQLGQRQFYVSTHLSGRSLPVFSLTVPPYGQVEEVRIARALADSRARYGRAEGQVSAEVFQAAKQYEVARLQAETRYAQRERTQAARKQQQAAASSVQATGELPSAHRMVRKAAFVDAPGATQPAPVVTAAPKTGRRGTRGGQGRGAGQKDDDQEAN